MATKRQRKIGWYEAGAKGERGPVRNGLPPRVLRQFEREVNKLRAKFFEKDEDGDYPVSFEIYDRTYGGVPRFFQLPHLHKLEQLPLAERREALADALRYAHANVEMAAGDLRLIGYVLEEYLRKVK